MSIVKNRFDDEWYLFNDSKQPIKLNLEQIQNKKAYYKNQVSHGILNSTFFDSRSVSQL